MVSVLVSGEVNFFHDDGPIGRLLYIQSSLLDTLSSLCIGENSEKWLIAFKTKFKRFGTFYVNFCKTSKKV